jgi:hypothetical protein
LDVIEAAQDRELRVRVIETAGTSRVLLTYQEQAADQASDSKPESSRSRRLTARSWNWKPSSMSHS